MTQTLCSGTGIWKVSADIPVHQPPVIKFNWNDGTGWQQIEGDQFEITEEKVTFSNVFYDVTVSQEGYNYDESREPLGDSIFTIANLKGMIVGLGTLNPTNSDGHYGIIFDSGQQIRRLGLNYQYKIAWPAGFSTFYYRAKILSIVRSDNGQVDRVYKLTIFRQNNLIYSETKSQNPLVQLFPESCEFTGNYISVYSEINLDKDSFLTSDILEKNIILKRCVGLINNNQILSTCSQVATVSGTCDVPRLKASVEPLCPPETCEIECGGNLCCYNAAGIAIKSYSGGIA